MEKSIELYHGNGGIMSHRLIETVMMKHFSKEKYEAADSAILNIPMENGSRRLAYTTDSYVIHPIFFSGGNIGKLAVAGTINDLAVSFAKPLYLTCAFILEEGFQIQALEKIVKSMAETAKDCGVTIVTGDTKVVPKGEADQIYINTSGIGKVLIEERRPIQTGDAVIISGTIGDHGTSILLERERLGLETHIQSDCAPISPMVNELVRQLGSHIKLMKDPTRGGVATTLNEISNYAKKGICIKEERLPVRTDVKSVCEILGLDPLYLANEGKALIVVESGYEEKAIHILRQFEIGKDSMVIGEIIEEKEVLLELGIGTHKILKMLYQDQLPRIC